MDDFPAGPASPEPGRPRLSVVIPVHNGGRDFERCLRRLRESDWTDYELLVVDDGSTDGSADLARAQGARVLEHSHAQGPAAARNAGALAAAAPVVFFLDADVAVHRDTLRLVIDRFDHDPSLSALFGSYDGDPAAPGLISQFRNLLHHHVHQSGSFVDDVRRVRTFWTGCGAIRKHAFLSIGGFDPGLYTRPAIEDIELGYRLDRAGCRTVLARLIQATHLKRWTLTSMINTDVFQRGIPWMLLIWRTKTNESDLNVSHGQRLCVAAVGLACVALCLLPIEPRIAVVFPLAGTLIVAVNHSFYRFLARKKGIAFALGSLPLHAIYYCCCGASVVLALAIRLWTDLQKRSRTLKVDDSMRIDAPPPGSSRPRSLGGRVFQRRSSRWTKR